MHTYLITGGAGFIGANFVKHMLATHADAQLIVLDLLTYAGNVHTIESDIDGVRCHFVKGDIGDRTLVESLFEKYPIDCVVNFAAESHVDRSIEDPQLFLMTNILGTQNLLNAARKAWTTGRDATGYPTWRPGVRFHQVSTDEVYGSLGPDGFFTETTPLAPHSPYSASKTSADLVAMAYHDTYRMPVSITRCSNNYGPYHFPEKLIPLMMIRATQGEKLPVYGDGLNVRDWLHVDDHCAAIDAILRHGREGEVYNVGGHNERSNIEVVRTILRALGKGEDQITYVTDRKGHDRRYAIDPTKIGRELGWQPATKFDDGIQATISWYQEHETWWADILSGAYEKRNAEG